MFYIQGKKMQKNAEKMASFTMVKGMIFFSCVLSANHSLSHTTPTDFADLSLSELFNESFEETREYFTDQSKWEFSYEFKLKELEGYRNGTNDIRNSDLLSDDLSQPGLFTILPTKIDQQVHLFKFKYFMGAGNSIDLTVPYLYQGTDHISSVEDYEFFRIETNGLGDISLSNSRTLFNIGESSIKVSLGLSFPTGSIDEKGDTPREAGDQQLPYTMQLGSGTIDIPIQTTYQSNNNWGISLNAKVRTGTNDRNYRLGNLYSASAFYQSGLKHNLFKLFGAMTYQHLGTIKGRDDDITVSAANPFPAPITNPDFYGGKKGIITIGAKTKSLDHGIRIALEAGIPVYQDLNGPQPKEKSQLSFKISKEI